MLAYFNKLHYIKICLNIKLKTTKNVFVGKRGRKWFFYSMNVIFVILCLLQLNVILNYEWRFKTNKSKIIN